MIVSISERGGRSGAAQELAHELRALGFSVVREKQGDVQIEIVEQGPADRQGQVCIDHPSCSLLEQAVRVLPMDFDSLPLLTEGESKIVREWTPHLVVERFKPTLYSYTFNRYGMAEGTDRIRAHFSAEIFRQMSRLPDGPFQPQSAFVGLIESPDGPLTVQRKVVSSNLEVRVKRFHIGSPLHRYRYTEKFPSTQDCGPIRRWSRFDQPIVCFDWRHPLWDDAGGRLADEPISDDYAAVWMDNVPHAKGMARRVFLWLEALFAGVDLTLVDICFFIDRAGRCFFGEISPDCMRVRLGRAGLGEARKLDKDLWRQGESGAVIRQRYQELYERLFHLQSREVAL